jgi:hypothetical protein
MHPHVQGVLARQQHMHHHSSPLHVDKQYVVQFLASAITITAKASFQPTRWLNKGAR